MTTLWSHKLTQVCCRTFYEEVDTSQCSLSRLVLLVLHLTAAPRMARTEINLQQYQTHQVAVLAPDWVWSLQGISAVLLRWSQVFIPLKRPICPFQASIISPAPYYVYYYGNLSCLVLSPNQTKKQWFYPSTADVAPLQVGHCRGKFKRIQANDSKRKIVPRIFVGLHRQRFWSIRRATTATTTATTTTTTTTTRRKDSLTKFIDCCFHRRRRRR